METLLFAISFLSLMIIVFYIVKLFISFVFCEIKTYNSIDESSSQYDEEVKMYGFYDDELAKHIGTSVYKIDSGKEVEVTSVVWNLNHFKKVNLPENIKYVGEVKEFIRKGKENNIKEKELKEEINDVIDVAIWFPYYKDFSNPLTLSYEQYLKYAYKEKEYQEREFVKVSHDDMPFVTEINEESEFVKEQIESAIEKM